MGGGGFIGGSVMDSAVGTVGALLSDIAFNFIPLPATVKTGAVGTLAKAGTSIALGMLASKVVGRAAAKKGVTGALTVQLYAYLKPMLAGAGVPGLGYYGAGYALNGMGAYISDSPSSLNAFVPNSLSGLGDPQFDENLMESSTYPGRFVGEYIPMR